MPGNETRLLIPWLNSTSVMINSEKGEVTQPPTTLTLASLSKGAPIPCPHVSAHTTGTMDTSFSPPLSSSQQKGAPPTQVQFHSEQTCTATLPLGVHICKRTRLADHLWGLFRSKIGWLHVSTTKMLKVLTSLSPSIELVELPFNSYYFVWFLANGMSMEHVSIWNHWSSYSFLPALRTNKIHSNTGIQNSFDLSSENILIISTQC